MQARRLLSWVGALIAAVLVTLFVFWLMQTLISSSGSVINDDPQTRLVDFIDLSKDDEVQTKERKPKKPPTPPKQPPKPEIEAPDVEAPAATSMNVSGANISADLKISTGLSGNISDGDYLPIVKVAPQYPRRAAQRGIEGYVVVEFSVNKAGVVIDPVVVESEPEGVFDRAAINAAKKFKYKPRIVDGQAIEVQGVRNIIRFQLDKGGR